MSDSDSDYIDIAEEVLYEEVENTDARPQTKGKGRGVDIDWVEIARFAQYRCMESIVQFCERESSAKVSKNSYACH